MSNSARNGPESAKIFIVDDSLCRSKHEIEKSTVPKKHMRTYSIIILDHLGKGTSIPLRENFSLQKIIIRKWMDQISGLESSDKGLHLRTV